MGIHFMDLLIVAAIGLAIFGPKTLQSVARSAGKTVNQAKAMKDKVMSELPVEEVSQIASEIPQIPLSSREAAQFLMQTDHNKPQQKADEQQKQEKKPTSLQSQETVTPISVEKDH